MALGLRSMIMLAITIIVFGIVFVNLMNIANKVADNNMDVNNIENYKELEDLTLSQLATYGNISMKILDVFKTKKIIGNMGLKKCKENESFIIIKLRIKNNGDLPYQISNMDFVLEDKNNNTYESEIDVLDIPNAITLTAIPPHRKLEGYLIFRIPDNLDTVWLCYQTSELNINYKKVLRWKINLNEVKDIDEFSVIK
ncbi:DUF4352 domain-containing protein [Methanocaldococcus sp.]